MTLRAKLERRTWAVISVGLVLTACIGDPDRGPLRLIEADPSETLDIGALYDDQRQLSAERLAELSDQAWKVDLEDDMRNALLAIPGEPRTWDVDVPKGSALEFSYASTPESNDFRFVVSASVGDEAKQLFDSASSPQDEAGSGWRAVRLGLDGFEGKETRIVLSVESSIEPSGALGFWAHPEIVTAVSEQTRAAMPNVVLISIDTLRADHLSLYGYDRETSPHLDRWAREQAVVFENAVAPAPTTRVSHASMMTGYNAHRHGAGTMGRSFDHLATAAELLREAGWTTVAVTGGGRVHPELGFSRGFEAYRHWARSVRGKDDELAWNLGTALADLDRLTDRPFFLFFHTYSIHTPYVPRQPWFGRWSDADPGASLSLGRRGQTPVPRSWIWASAPDEPRRPLPEEFSDLPVDLYDSGIGYMDEQLGILLERLERPDLRDNTLVILTSDHGEALGEHGRGHGLLSENNLMVPLVIAAPGRLEAGRSVEEQVRVSDVLPTILDFVGLPAREDIDGVSLRRAMAGERGTVPNEAWTAYAHDGGMSLRVSNRLKYVLQTNAFTRGPTEFFYDLETKFLKGPAAAFYDLESGPGESRDLGTGSEMASRLGERLVEVASAEFPGLRMRVENSEDDLLTVLVHGESVKWNTVMSFDPPCACAKLLPDGRARFEVPAGSAYTLIFEEARGRTFEVELALEGVASHQESFALPLEGVDAVTWIEDRWERGKPKAGSRTGVSVWRQGVTGAETEVLDDGLRGRLRALGYLR